MKHRTVPLLWSIVIGMIVTISGSSHAVNLYADLVFLNANIITVDDARPKAEAVAVRRGKFIAVGTNEDAKTFVGGRNHRNRSSREDDL